MTCLNYPFLDFSSIENLKPILEAKLKPIFFLLNRAPEIQEKKWKENKERDREGGTQSRRARLIPWAYGWMDGSRDHHNIDSVVMDL